MTAAEVGTADGWEYVDLSAALAKPAPPETFTMVTVWRRPRPWDNAYVYRVSWRFAQWDPDFWRIRYVGYRQAKVIVDRVAARGGEWKVERTGQPTAELGWTQVNMRPRSAKP